MCLLMGEKKLGIVVKRRTWICACFIGCDLLGFTCSPTGSPHLIMAEIKGRNNEPKQSKARWDWMYSTCVQSRMPKVRNWWGGRGVLNPTPFVNFVPLARGIGHEYVQSLRAFDHFCLFFPLSDVGSLWFTQLHHSHYFQHVISTYFEPGSGSWSLGVYCLNINRRCSSYNKSKTNSIAHDLNREQSQNNLKLKGQSTLNGDEYTQSWKWSEHCFLP